MNLEEKINRISKLRINIIKLINITIKIYFQFCMRLKIIFRIKKFFFLFYMIRQLIKLEYNSLSIGPWRLLNSIYFSIILLIQFIAYRNTNLINILPNEIIPFFILRVSWFSGYKQYKCIFFLDFGNLNE